MNSLIQTTLTLSLKKCNYNLRRTEGKMVQDKKVYFDLAYIVSCALKQKKPIFDGIDLQSVQKEAKKDSLLPLLGTVVPQFRESFYQNAYRNSNFEKWKKQLYEFFDRNDILHCSLKGIVVKDYYPQPMMRFMADYDVLFDPVKKDEVRKWLKENNVDVLYYREIRKGEKEDSVLFNKQFHFELHYCLLNDEYCEEPWYKYFSNNELYKRLIHVSGAEYRLTDEDFYLFFLVHAYKHSSYVCDMRELIDCYLINQNTNYDKYYVEEKLREFGLIDYEAKIRMIGKRVLEGEALSLEEEEYFLKCASNGTFGDPIINELRRIADGEEITQEVINRAIKKIFIIPKDVTKEMHPIIYYSVVLRPLYHAARIIKRLINWKETKMRIDQYKEALYRY